MKHTIPLNIPILYNILGNLNTPPPKAPETKLIIVNHPFKLIENNVNSFLLLFSFVSINFSDASLSLLFLLQ